ncbi:hypothetical protein CC80DRAFT_229993 [Byssothecium circinans]|uniref:Uncharacterized protein n=1 Tax=Byssothecium circinans TaxID=147558 RepID=A0A6A5U9U8_9PLEO|nr:hypothetical protein CC80DRAFT_229993 [Byssothecium circinans]
MNSPSPCPDHHRHLIPLPPATQSPLTSNGPFRTTSHSTHLHMADDWCQSASKPPPVLLPPGPPQIRLVSCCLCLSLHQPPQPPTTSAERPKRVSLPPSQPRLGPAVAVFANRRQLRSGQGAQS